MSVDLLDGHEVANGVDHPDHLGAVLADDAVADPPEPESTQGVTLVLLATDLRLDLRDLKVAHDAASCRLSCLRAATVACTMLIALDEPSDFDRTSWMPAHSRTARTGPPAITPVPGAAGRSRTTPAAFSPCTGCGIVPWMRGTLKKCFLASSTPLAIAAGTSLALP